MPPGGGPYPASYGQPPPPPGYTTYSPYGGGGGSRQHPQGTTILVLGILSLVICGLLGPVAWIMGQKAIREMDSDPSASWANRGKVNAGRICGIIATALLVVGIIVVVARSGN